MTSVSTQALVSVLSSFRLAWMPDLLSWLVYTSHSHTHAILAWPHALMQRACLCWDHWLRQWRNDVMVRAARYNRNSCIQISFQQLVNNAGFLHETVVNFTVDRQRPSFPFEDTRYCQNYRSGIGPYSKIANLKSWGWVEVRFWGKWSKVRIFSCIGIGGDRWPQLIQISVNAC